MVCDAAQDISDLSIWVDVVQPDGDDQRVNVGGADAAMIGCVFERQAEAPRLMVVVAPGWIRTALGGAEAPLGIEDSIPHLVDVLLSKRERPGLEYLDYLGRAVP